MVVVLLFAGYAAYYFCRAYFSVAMPLLIEELGRHGVASGEAIVRLGSIASFGVLAYAIGKLFLTGLGDFWGGKRSFTIGLGGAIAFTPLLVALTFGEPVMKLVGRFTRAIPRGAVPHYGNVMLDLVRQVPAQRAHRPACGTDSGNRGQRFLGGIRQGAGNRVRGYEISGHVTHGLKLGRHAPGRAARCGR